MKMKKLFPFVNLVLFSVLLISCSDFNVFTDVAFGSDMESVENILAQKKIKYKSHLAAAQEFLDIDLENTEEIADAIANKHAGGIGEYLYKDYIYYLQKICEIFVEILNIRLNCLFRCFFFFFSFGVK